MVEFSCNILFYYSYSFGEGKLCCVVRWGPTGEACGLSFGERPARGVCECCVGCCILFLVVFVSSVESGPTMPIQRFVTCQNVL